MIFVFMLLRPAEVERLIRDMGVELCPWYLDLLPHIQGIQALSPPLYNAPPPPLTHLSADTTWAAQGLTLAQCTGAARGAPEQAAAGVSFEIS